MNRRDFLRLGAGGVALSVLPLPGCAPGVQRPIEHGDGAIAIADDGTRYELEPDRHHLIITPPGQPARRVGGLGRGIGELNHPAAVVVLGALAYVVDLGNHRVQAFDRDGRSRGVFGDGELLYPSGITTRDDRLVVADTGHGRLVELVPGGGRVERLNSDALMAPRGLAALDDHLLVADIGRREVIELRDDGAVVRRFGGDWVLPYGVATDGDAIYVADRARPALAVFDRDGRRIDTVPLTGPPSHVTFAGDGQLYAG